MSTSGSKFLKSTCTDIKKHKLSKSFLMHLFCVFFTSCLCVSFMKTLRVSPVTNFCNSMYITCTNMYIPYTKEVGVLKVRKNLLAGLKMVAATFCGNVLNGYCGFVVV